MAYEKNDKLHIVAVNAAIRRNDGTYLVLKRSETEKAMPGKWAFPGGKVEGNQSIDAALAEEVAEESGLSIKSAKVLIADTSFVRLDEQTVKVLVFLCEVEDADQTVVLEAGSFTDYRWITAAELTDLDHVGLTEEIAKAEEIIATGIDLSVLAVASKA
jgi:8-oxo-dGTP diphosphatase